MTTSELFPLIIDYIEDEININSDCLKEILSQIKILQSIYDIDIDNYNQNILSDEVKQLSEKITDLISTQTSLIELYAKISNYLIINHNKIEKDHDVELVLLNNALKYYLSVENYEICATINKTIVENFPTKVLKS